MDALDQVAVPVLFLGAGTWIAWLLVGTLVNRRRAAAISRWLYGEAHPYGAKLYIRWITLAAFELTVPEARAPFRQLSLTGFLESREMPFVWLWNRVRRRGDLLIARAELRHAPAWGLEMFRPQSLLAADARRTAEAGGWPLEQGPDGLWRAYGGVGAAAQGDRLVAALGGWAPHLDRLAVRRNGAHLLVSLAVGGVALDEAPPLGKTLARVAEAVGKGR